MQPWEVKLRVVVIHYSSLVKYFVSGPRRPDTYQIRVRFICTQSYSSSRSTDLDVIFSSGGERPLCRRVLEGLGERWHYCHCSARYRFVAVMICRWRCGHRWRRRTSSRAFFMMYINIILFSLAVFFFIIIISFFRLILFWSFVTRSLRNSERSSFRLLAHSSQKL